MALSGVGPVTAARSAMVSHSAGNRAKEVHGSLHAGGGETRAPMPEASSLIGDSLAC